MARDSAIRFSGFVRQSRTLAIGGRMLLNPFPALRAGPGRAADVIAPPYDVVSSDEARARAAGKPWSFLHVSRPEIDLPVGADPYGEEAYSKAAANFERMIDEGVLIRDASPCYYVYSV